MADWDGSERRNTGELTVLSAKLQSLHDDVSEMRSALKELTSAITKLALIEERQTNTQLAQDRAFNAIKSVEIRLYEIEKLLPVDLAKRIQKLEEKAPENALTSKWVWHFVTLVIGGALVAAFDHFKKGH